MKKIIFTAAILMSCSGETSKDSADVVEDIGPRILTTDVGVQPETHEPDEDYDFACSLTYVQIPYNNVDQNTGIETELYSHRLWSMPVRRLKESSGPWIAFVETYGSTLPNLHNFDPSDPEDAVYASIILEDGTELFDQSVRAMASGLSGNEWHVCESYNCGPNGCQTYPMPNSSDWSCQSIFNEDGLDNCPCIFNDNGYTYCDLSNDQEEETGETP